MGKGSEGVRKLPSEFDLAVACCKWPPSEERDRHVADASISIDWTLFQDVVKRHRIGGVVWHALRHANVEIPADIGFALSDRAARIPVQNLRVVAESVRLQQQFADRNVPLLFLKGVTLGAIAYGTLTLKMGWDVDILVPFADLEESADLLIGMGYSPLTPSNRHDVSRWHGGCKESVWYNKSGNIYVELHTALVDNSTLLHALDAFSSPPQLVEVSPGVILPTLGRDELFAYLCVHGASSNWFRLKWIADVAALLSSADAGEVERLYSRSQSLGAGRAAAQALLLCTSLFKTNLPEGLRDELHSDRVNLHLERSALRTMAGRSLATELHDLPLGTLSIHLVQPFLLPGWRFKVSEISRQLASILSGFRARMRRA